MNLQVEESLNEILIEKIKYLEYLNSSLKQTNKLLSNKLISLTKKYNDLKKELIDTECHINFCKKNLTELISFKKGEDKENQSKNFLIFKNKINSLFEYGDDFMKINSEMTIYNIIIDNIQNIQEENINLKMNLDELHKMVNQNTEINYDNNNFNNNKNKEYPTSISNNQNNSIITGNSDRYNNYETPNINNYNYSEQKNEINDDNLLIYQNSDRPYFN